MYAFGIAVPRCRGAAQSLPQLSEIKLQLPRAVLFAEAQSRSGATEAELSVFQKRFYFLPHGDILLGYRPPIEAFDKLCFFLIGGELTGFV